MVGVRRFVEEIPFVLVLLKSKTVLESPRSSEGEIVEIEGDISTADFVPASVRVIEY